MNNNKKSEYTWSLLFVGVATTATLYLSVYPSAGIAYAAGFLIFSLNLMAISSLSSLAVDAAKGHGLTSGAKMVAGGLAVLKFTGLVLALFFALVSLKLDGMYLALGSFVAMLVMALKMSFSYLRNLAKMTDG